MTYDDIRKDLAVWTKLLQISKKDISSGQILNYVNVLNELIKLRKTIRSLEKILDIQDNRTIHRRCDNLKTSAEKLQDIVSDSVSERASYIKVTNRLNDLIGDCNELSELLAEASQSQPGSEEKDGQVTPSTIEGKWSNPMTKSTMMSKVKIYGYKKFNTFAKQYGLHQAGNRQLWQIRLDGMDRNTKQKFEKS